ncbi:hypothetical protein T8A63_15350 [Sulfitobacter sp. OXR-159]|uniref:hypothetical protein n=1 Tax=Sulfitobacter sp. OXR-159 TaxID=3100174 RepID=UPI002AC8F21B|nr:hypothetical protein [Sulfitobacter sp. OXR-159]WPZ28989.1 hypothetical protein T8A63_15350 [Sulfitobacter sp. OXR-159]
MFQDAAGTTPVTAPGQPVGLMLDKSGNGHHASQATASKRPTYQTDGTLHYLSFDGVDDAMQTADIDFTGTDEMSVFAGVRRLSGSTAAFVELGASGTGSHRYALYANNPSGVFSFTGRGSAAAHPDQLAQSSFSATPDSAVVSAFGNISAAANSIRKNGVEGSVASWDQGVGSYGDDLLNIGARNQTSLFFNGHLYGLTIVGKTTTDAEIANTERHLAGKTGVTL